MKKRTLLRSIILITLALLLVVGGDAKAFDQLIVYLPLSSRISQTQSRQTDDAVRWAVRAN